MQLPGRDRTADGATALGSLEGLKLLHLGAGGGLASTVLPFNQFSHPAHSMAAQMLMWDRHGLSYDWEHVGTWGNKECFSQQQDQLLVA